MMTSIPPDEASLASVIILHSRMRKGSRDWVGRGGPFEFDWASLNSTLFAHSIGCTFFVSLLCLIPTAKLLPESLPSRFRRCYETKQLAEVPGGEGVSAGLIFRWPATGSPNIRGSSMEVHDKAIARSREIVSEAYCKEVLGGQAPH